MAESPVQMECVVKDIVETGSHGGAGNLVICHVVMIHVNENVLDEQGRIDPHKIDLVARMGNDPIAAQAEPPCPKLPKPTTKPAIGHDRHPGIHPIERRADGTQSPVSLATLETLPG